MFNRFVISCLIIASFICFSCAANVPSKEVASPNQLQSGNVFDLLADDTVNEIFEYLEVDDYTTFRLISKRFCKLHDNCVYRLSRNSFPGLTRAVLHQWNVEDPVADHLKHRVIVLLNVKPILESFDIELDIITESNLRQYALQILDSFENSNQDVRLCLVSLFLRLEYVQGNDIFDNVSFSFPEEGEMVKDSWIFSLGLTAIARELSIRYEDIFIHAVGSRGEGLLAALRARKHGISRFIVRFLRSRSYQFNINEISYLNLVIKELVEARYWDLLQEIYEMNKSHDYSYYLKDIAENGFVGGLRALSHPAKTEAPKMTSWAAEKGHLAFLQEMDALGLLQKSCYPAIHAAAANGQTECLEFLVSRLGTEYLGYTIKKGIMPIYLAAGFDNPETLRAIIRLYPRYKPISSGTRTSKSLSSSPLQNAVNFNLPNNARILLKHFPELISLNDDVPGRNYTVIHLAMRHDALLLRVLLEYAPPEVITARDNDGYCALHLCQMGESSVMNYIEKLELLMNTGNFTGMERNSMGVTPIRIVWATRSMSKEKLMEIFKLDTDEELEEALRIVKGEY